MSDLGGSGGGGGRENKAMKVPESVVGEIVTASPIQVSQYHCPQEKKSRKHK